MVDGLAVAREPRRAVHQPARAHRGPGRRSRAAAGRAGTPRTRRTTAPTRARRGRRDDARDTPGPTASTTPAPSWPSTAGHGVSARAVDRVVVGVADAARRRGARAPRPARGRREVELLHLLRRRPSASQHRGADLHSARSLAAAAALQRAQLLDRDVAAHQVLRPRPRRAAAPSSSQIAPSLRGQRVWKTQPDGGSRRSGSRPRAGSARGRRRRSSARPRAAPRCTDGAGPSNTTSAGPSSISRPR